MSVARVTEIIATSEKSFDDAVSNGVARAAETLHKIRSAWVKDQTVEVKSGKIVMYKVVLKITFILK